MADLVAGGRIAELIALLLIAEFLLLLALRHFKGVGPQVGDFAFSLAAGLGLVLALAAALRGADAIWIAGWLAFSFAAHLADLLKRWPK